MPFRAYGIINDTDKDVLVMGTKASDYLAGFLVFFGGRLEASEPSKEAFLRELAEESNKRVACPPDDVRRFTVIDVDKPTPARLFFFRCTNPTYTTGEIPHGSEIRSVVAVSVDKLVRALPDNPAEVTPALVANALVSLYGGGPDIAGYRNSGIMQALSSYLIQYYYRGLAQSRSRGRMHGE
jgi:8-oxo-dGTP pyrophosphatase MutT (NUDIX family)